MVIDLRNTLLILKVACRADPSDKALCPTLLSSIDRHSSVGNNFDARFEGIDRFYLLEPLLQSKKRRFSRVYPNTYDNLIKNS